MSIHNKEREGKFHYLFYEISLLNPKIGQVYCEKDYMPIPVVNINVKIQVLAN